MEFVSGKKQRQIWLGLFVLFVFCTVVCMCSPLCDHCNRNDPHSHGHHHHHDCDHGHAHHDHDHHERHATQSKLPEELAEEDDMKLYGFDNYLLDDHHHHRDIKLSGLGFYFLVFGFHFLFY